MGVCCDSGGNELATCNPDRGHGVWVCVVGSGGNELATCNPDRGHGVWVCVVWQSNVILIEATGCRCVLWAVEGMS